MRTEYNDYNTRRGRYCVTMPIQHGLGYCDAHMFYRTNLLVKLFMILLLLYIYYQATTIEAIIVHKPVLNCQIS